MRLGIIGGNLYIDFFISGVVELPGALLILLTIERVGRRLPFAASNVVAGVACLVTAFLPEGNFPQICLLVRELEKTIKDLQKPTLPSQAWQQVNPSDVTQLSAHFENEKSAL